jgi:hypothetical protein
MVEVLCLWHRGIRCALPSRQVLAAEPALPMEAIALWDEAEPAHVVDRRLNVVTAEGPSWLEGSQLSILTLNAQAIHPLPGVLRAFLPLPHVVGLAEVAGDLVWLVDAKRFAAPRRAELASTATPIPSKPMPV